MLVLSRKIDQKIKIDSDIFINVVSINQGQVKIGIEAPDGVNAVRDEHNINCRNEVWLGESDI